MFTGWIVVGDMMHLARVAFKKIFPSRRLVVIFDSWRVDVIVIGWVRGVARRQESLACEQKDANYCDLIDSFSQNVLGHFLGF